MKTLLKRASVVGGALLMLNGCGGGGNSTTNLARPLEARVTTDKATYKRGERPVVTVTFRNLTSKSQYITSGSSSFLFVNVRAEDTNQQVGFIASAALTVVTTQRIAAGQSYSESLTWGEQSNTNPADALARGRYVLTSSGVASEPNKVTSVNTTITLTE